MKRGLSLLLVMLVAGAALYYSNRHEKDAGLHANAVVNLAAETQRELSRVPMEATRISNEEEIEIGNRIAARYEHRERPSSENDAAMQQYVSDVGANVVGGSLAA